MKHRTLKFTAPLLAVLLLQSCIYVDREGSNPRSITRGTTIGEELEDLSDAYEDGLLSQQEYDRLRNRILNN
ncbi:MAG: hypothetical protein COA71_05315 [SAR86 cluster bacterium]|uniref:SHOCT domain-containing protein n=1 Tax=SAR86 cluster bacterium TaxID=2030880 RepID=A0A2A5CGC3_9GAMM|nr:MAG: hypothetical protein COA71_05315 [SAR86 cluster bacterium]